MTRYRGDGTMSSKTSYTYDAKGNEVSYLLETSGYSNSSRKLVYDDKGNKIEEINYDGKGEIMFRKVRAYDAHGSMTEEKTYEGQDNYLHKTTWTYDYDKTGNWIKRTQYSNEGVDFDIAERKIIYY